MKNTVVLTVKGNALATDANASNLPTRINLGGGLTASVSANLITGGKGALINGGNGSVTGNGIGIIADPGVALVTGNTIVQSPFGSVFDCVAGHNVHCNTILNSVVGVFEVPAAAVTTNTYYNVSTIPNGGRQFWKLVSTANHKTFAKKDCGLGSQSWRLEIGPPQLSSASNHFSGVAVNADPRVLKEQFS